VTTPLPIGFCVALDADTKQLDDNTLFGGSPARVMRLTTSGRRAWTELRAGPVHSTAAGALARRLTDAGLAHPRPSDLAAPLDVVVIIPVRDRPAMLAGCLAALGRRHPAVVVDDKSSNPQAVAEVAAAYAATVLRRPVNGGPAAARNTGLARVTSDVVAFLDSDCVPPAGWIERLAAHLADPLVAAVAPRVVAMPTASTVGRYTAACGSLDLGAREARVAPSTRVSYVPTAALVVRRTALLEIAGDGEIFDPTLRYGEDVDVIWRLHEAGWRIRYVPSVQVGHYEPDTWPGLLTRRFHYGTSAAPLARRHPAAMTPLVLQPWPTMTVAALLGRRPALAGLSFAAATLTMSRTLRGAGIPTAGVVGAMLTSVQQTWLGIGRYSTQFTAPALAAVLVAPGGSTRARRWGRRAAIASLLLGPPLATRASRRPALDPFRFVLGNFVDDVAYGAGVWSGCVQARTTAPIRPVISWRPIRIGPSPSGTASRSAAGESPVSSAAPDTRGST
jgi:mycofactocin glycosyltransferase